MKNYEKPDAVVTPEWSEGVFAASGAAEEGLYSDFFVNGTDGIGTRIGGDADFVSGSAKEYLNYELTVNFNQSVTVVDTSSSVMGYLQTVGLESQFLSNTGTSICVRFKYNATTRIRMGNWFYVQPCDGLAVIGSSIRVV